MPAASELADACRARVLELRRAEAAAPPPGADARDALRAGHALTTSALVCCLAHDRPERDRMRLAALSHELPETERGSDDPQVGTWIELLRAHDQLLARGERPGIPVDEPERLLALAHLAASERLPVRAKGEFANHPLVVDLSVDLVYGGATKIKQYVFESARLPEIRGASALLDQINRLDLPALWGQLPATPSELRQARYLAARDWFAASFGAVALDAPECVLYASGGNILALAPSGLGARLAQAIERRYTEETLVAQSVAVVGTFGLLELQYGRQPQAFWIDGFDAMIEQPDALRLIEQSFGTRDSATIFGADALGATGPTTARKGFGELVTLLAASADRRRAGDGAGTGAPRYPAFVDLLSAARRCSSCDVRPAVRRFRQPIEQHLCEACRRKRAAGVWSKKGVPPAPPPRPGLEPEPRDPIVPEYAWLPSWGDWLEWQAHVVVRATVDDLPDLAGFARGAARGFVGLIYADGNNVGAHVAGLASIAAYRRFAQQMAEANEQAVARALQMHLAPDGDGVWPFEIITIGGDDVLLFVPADRAPAVAATIARAFGDAMQAYDTAITLSAGVLLMADHTPVRFARDLVEALLKSAKQRSKDGDKGPTIDFMALKAASMVSETIATYRRAAYQRVRRRERGGQARETRLQLTQRPYTLEDFDKLLAAGRELKRANFPPSQLHQLAAIVGEGQQLRASIDYHYFVGRGRASADSAYAIFEQQIGTLCRSADSAPWRRTKAEPERQEYDTPLLDLVEILPFVGSAEREERA